MRNRKVKKLGIQLVVIGFVFGSFLFYTVVIEIGSFPFNLLLLCILFFFSISIIVYKFLQNQSNTIMNAVELIDEYIEGNKMIRLECDEEGELYQLFHAINALVTSLNAHVEKEKEEKIFLKRTLSDISHQLKTPLSALSIYHSIIQEEIEHPTTIKEFSILSEQELERLELLVQNLLKLTKLDAGMTIMEKKEESIIKLMEDIEYTFSIRVRQEKKEFKLKGDKTLKLYCDYNWLFEAIRNIIKNALEHTDEGGKISIEWQKLPSIIQIKIKDDGKGIHPEDFYHIFKRFYRSRFSKDINGIGLGLALAKSIVEEHHGTIEVVSELGVGTTFIMNFLIATEM